MNEKLKIKINNFSKIPVGASGVALGFFGVFNALIAILNFSEINIAFDFTNLRVIPVIISGFLLIFLFVKNIIHKETFKNELNHNLFSSFVPTIFMTLMLFAGWICSYQNNVLNYFGVILWYSSVVFHFLYMILFFKKIIIKHKIYEEKIYASWYVPPIGMVVACTVYQDLFQTGMVPNEIFYIIWFTGFINFIIMFPFVIYKTIFFDNIENHELASLGIFAAPANLCLAGFISIFGQKEHLFLNDSAFFSLLFLQIILAFSTTLILFVMLFKIVKHKFNPTWAALTFPLAISSTSMILSYSIFKNSEIGIMFLVVSIIWLSIALIFIFYITIKYYILFYQIIFSKV